MIRPGVLVMFRKAKFYNKIFTPIGTDQVKFTELAIDSYQKIAEYCESHPHHRKHVQQEQIQTLMSTILCFFLSPNPSYVKNWIKKARH